jgi:hypothetical protein
MLKFLALKVHAKTCASLLAVVFLDIKEHWNRLLHRWRHLQIAGKSLELYATTYYGKPKYGTPGKLGKTAYAGAS